MTEEEKAPEEESIALNLDKDEWKNPASIINKLDSRRRS